MLRAIGADTHIFESTQVWDYIDAEMYPRRPIIVSGPGDTVYRRSSFWLIDGNIFPKSAGKGGFLLGTPKPCVAYYEVGLGPEDTAVSMFRLWGFW